MTPTPLYNIQDFIWNNQTQTFYADAWDLYAVGYRGEGAFPSEQRMFIIKNFETGNMQTFYFIKEWLEYWLFESEEGLKCVITVD